MDIVICKAKYVFLYTCMNTYPVQVTVKVNLGEVSPIHLQYLSTQEAVCVANRNGDIMIVKPASGEVRLPPQLS